MGAPRLVAAATIGLCLPPAIARAQPLDPSARARLDRGELVSQREVVDDDRGRWVGGTSYILVGAPPERIVPHLYDVASWPKVLPRTRQVTLIGVGRDGDAVLAIEQGTAVLHGSYVARFRHDDAGGAHIVRFWLDARHPHAIDDAYGWLAVEPAGPGRSLVTSHVMVDVGPGVLRWLFEDKIQNMLLALPVAVRRAVGAQP